jgi:hypothetical protein
MPQTAAVLAGEVAFTWGVFTTRPMVAAGRLKAIGYGATKRSRFLPDLPTFVEAGYPDVDMPVWFGIMGPAGMPRPLVERIHRDMLAIVNDPEFRDRELLNRAYEPSGLGLDDFAALIKRELAVRAELVRVSGARVEWAAAALSLATERLAAGVLRADALAARVAGGLVAKRLLRVVTHAGFDRGGGGFGGHGMLQ